MPLDISSTLVLVSTSLAAGLVGCFAVMRRMALAGDALSHVALPGIGLALLAGIHPLVGALAALLVGTLLVWGVQTQTRLASETVVGVIFSCALAVGSMLTSGEDLVEALLGRPSGVSPWEVAAGIAAGAVVSAFVLTQRHRLVLAMVSRDIATTSGVRVARLDLAFLLTFAVTVAMGLRFLGVLLMGSLIIIPAATAKRLARSLSSMFVLAASVALIAALGGAALARHLGRPSGPVIVVLAGAMFVLALPVPRRT